MTPVPIPASKWGRGRLAWETGTAFAEVDGRRGLVIGVLPASSEDDPTPPPGYPNPWVELVVRMHLQVRGEGGDAPLSRNHINVLTSDVVVALRGGAGTRSEVELALRYGTPVAWYRPEVEDQPSAAAPVLRTLDEVRAFVRGQIASSA